MTGAAMRDMEPDLGPGIAGGAFIPGWAHVDDPFELARDLAGHARARGAPASARRCTRRSSPKVVSLTMRL